MTMAIWQRTIVDEAGSVAPFAEVTVRRAVAGLPLAVLKSDRAGLVAKVNPFNATADGFAQFFAAGGAYQITATLGVFSITWDYVAIGTAAETDALAIVTPTPLIFAFDASTVDADPGAGTFRLNNASPAAATQVFIDNNNDDYLGDGGTDVSARLDTFDDHGTSANRGVLEIFDPTQPSTVFRQYNVTGSVVDGGGYRKVTVAHIAGLGSFVAGQQYMAVFWARGDTGAGLANVVEDTSPQLGGDLDVNGFDIILAGGEVPLSTGRHSLWVPASSMVSNSTNGAASTTTEHPINDVMKVTKDFDQTTSEFVQFDIAMPVSWDKNSTFSFVPYWTAAAGSGTVAWNMAARAFDDTEAIDQAFGTNQASLDTLEAINRVHIGPESPAITPAGVQRDNPLMTFQVFRDVSSDNLTADAKLIGVMIFMRIGAPNDSFGFQS